jgi:2-polyprenyl-3-methyl-5-hydroxy-6-metoxy-1,4-benzoquinol methylase
MDIQVNKEHYFNGYDTKKRWMSYWYQINEVLNLNPNNVLEIGIGNGTVSTHLKSRNINVTTVDVDKSLNPDYVCDVKELTSIFNEHSFDVVLCSEVLEHIPFEYFEHCLDQIKQVSNKNVVISLPDARTSCLYFKLPLLQAKHIFFPHPIKKEHDFNGEHYWEINKRGFEVEKIERAIKKHFNIINCYNVVEQPYHRFYVLSRLT